MKLFYTLKICVLLIVTHLLVCGCELVNGPELNGSELNGSETNTGTNDDTNACFWESLNIAPKQVNCSGVDGFALKMSDSTKGTPSLTSDSVPADVNLYSVDENGQMSLTVFTYKYVDIEVPDKGDSDDKVVDQPELARVLQELSVVLQIIPTDVSTLGGYVLFSDCRYVMNDAEVSDEVRSIGERYMSVSGKSYLIRKSDGLMYDITDRRSWFNTYFISLSGNVYIMSHAIFRMEDNGETIDFRQITQPIAITPDKVMFDADENLYLMLSDGCDVYTSTGSYTFIPYPDTGYMTSDNIWCKFNAMVEPDNPGHVLMTSDLFELKNLKWNHEGTYEIVYSGMDHMSEMDYSNINLPENREIISMNVDEIRDNRSHRYEFQNWHIFPMSITWKVKFLLLDKDSIKERSVRQSLWVLFNVRTGEYEIRTDYQSIYDSVRTASIRDKNFCYNVRIVEQEGLILEVLDPIKCTVENRNYLDLPFMKTMVNTNWYDEIRNDEIYIVINGRSTIDGSYTSAWLNISTGEYDATINEDNREVITYFKIN